MLRYFIHINIKKIRLCFKELKMSLFRANWIYLDGLTILAGDENDKQLQVKRLDQEYKLLEFVFLQCQYDY